MNNKFQFSSGSSVRDRIAGASQANERVGRGLDTDFTGMTSADGFVTIINRREGRTYMWIATCTKPGCMCSGITFTHDYLVNGGVIKCASSGHDSASAEPVVMRQPSEARVELREREDIVRSVGQRYDAANRAKEIAEFEKNSGAQ
jgi:hypothetical protein